MLAEQVLHAHHARAGAAEPAPTTGGVGAVLAEAATDDGRLLLRPQAIALAMQDEE